MDWGKVGVFIRVHFIPKTTPLFFFFFLFFFLAFNSSNTMFFFSVLEFIAFITKFLMFIKQ